MKKIGLIGIDLQNDFVLKNGSLSVPGAEEDAKRIAEFITKNKSKITQISMTMDTHRNFSIFYPEFWKDKDGNHPVPFTTITTQDIKDGKWTTTFNPLWSFKYVEELEKNGKYSLTLWTKHCMVGTKGHCIVDVVMDAINDWELSTCKFANYYMKGTNPMTENYSVFKAEVVYPNAPETDLQQNVLHILNNCDVLYLCGEAQSHCTKFSLDDINKYCPELSKKIVILEDCMSPIGTFDINTDPVYQEAVRLGAKIMKSTDVVL